MLGTEFVGAYAAGSLALNAFQPGRSYIDIAPLCRDPLSEAVKRELIAPLRHNALPCPARGLELVVCTVVTAQSGTGESGLRAPSGHQRDVLIRTEPQHPASKRPGVGRAAGIRGLRRNTTA